MGNSYRLLLGTSKNAILGIFRDENECAIFRFLHFQSLE